MQYPVIVLAAYLIGCSNMALYLSKLWRVDLRSAGSGNLGASNAAVLLGWGSGIAVAVHDIGKSVLAVCLARLLFPELEYAGAAAGVASVFGHIFPFYNRFKGGKGFASYYGMTIALNWKLAIIIGIGIVLATLITDYIVSGTALTIVAVPIYMGITHGSWLLALILFLGTAVIVYKHRENITRIMNGTEIGLRSTARGENRIK